MDIATRFREWRIDRMADRIARRPHGRRARATYGADDAHSFLWPPVLEALQLRPEDRLLDVGCGGGAFLRHVLATVGCAAAGLDHSGDMVRLTRRRSPGLRVVRADAAAMPFADAEFTAVSCLVAFFFFPDPVAVLRELRRVLDPERGRIAVMTTAPEARGTPASPEPLASRGHFHSDEELVALARAAGLREPRVAYREPWAQLLVAQP